MMHLVFWNYVLAVGMEVYYPQCGILGLAYVLARDMLGYIPGYPKTWILALHAPETQC